jgi:hypothetical protein
MHHGDGLPLEIDPAELKPVDFVHTLFVARKTIGYLFMQPISATAVLISLMRHATDAEVLAELGALLFDPLLLNFTGKVRDYVVQQSDIESGKVKETLDKALKAVDDYLDDLRSVILNLVSKSVLLYGRTSIDYVYAADGQIHRMETPLQRHGTEIEFPRMENFDPFGQNYMLRIFRNERFRA